MPSKALAGPKDVRGSDGFTLMELMVVVGIIGVIAAVALPAIGLYIRNYKIRGAADQVAGEIQTAKLTAIKKNVNFGVVFVVLTDSTYQYFVEDGTPAGLRQDYPTAQRGPIRTLPIGINFAAAAVGPDVGFRFGRLGGMCNPDLTTPDTCRDLSLSNIDPVPTGSYIGFDAANPDPTLQGAVITLAQSSNSLTRRLVVTPGGRVRVLNR